jgi:hypothetical protein
MSSQIDAGHSRSLRRDYFEGTEPVLYDDSFASLNSPLEPLWKVDPKIKVNAVWEMSTIHPSTPGLPLLRLPDAAMQLIYVINCSFYPIVIWTFFPFGIGLEGQLINIEGGVMADDTNSNNENKKISSKEYEKKYRKN